MPQLFDMKEEQVILVNEKDEVLGYAPKMAAHEQALLHRAFSVFIFNDAGELLLQQRAAHKYHSPKLWTNTVCSHQRKDESNITAGQRRLMEEMGMQAGLKEVFHFIYKAELDQGLTEHELDHVMIGFSNQTPEINPDEVMAYRWANLDDIKKDIALHPGQYTEWFKIIFQNSYQQLEQELDNYFLTKPIKFRPLFKEKPWGGDKLKKILNKNIPSNKTGESWEVSTIPDNYSIVEEGYFKGKNLKYLLEQYREKLVGQSVYQQFGNDFPLLIKYIDANDDLSIQVHPDDEIAAKYHQSFGKNELWHIIQVEPGAAIYLGLKKNINKDKYLQHLKNGTLENILNKINVKAGETYYIPAGTVHTIGEGILLAEIQQSSDITYRIYDWNRMGLDGKPRELHTEKALEAINFEAKPLLQNTEQIKTAYFNIEIMHLNNNRSDDLSKTDSFVILMNIEGQYMINGQNFHKGETLFLPAVTSNLDIKTLKKGYLLKIYL